jgi:hypothetical protein
MADMALRGLSHVQRRRGKFRELHQQLGQRPRTGIWHRVWGDLWWTQGRLGEAIDSYGEAVTWAEREGLGGEVATSAACRAWAAALQSTTGGEEAVGFARQALGTVTITWADLQVGCAEALLAAGDGTAVQRRCALLHARAVEHGLTSSAAYAAFAQAFHFAVANDVAGLTRARAVLRALVRGDEFAYLCEIVDSWLGERAGEPVPAADWVDGTQATAARWRQIVSRRRSEREGTR